MGKYKIQTPKGLFLTLKEAGDAFGVTKDMIRQRIKNKRKKDFYYSNIRIRKFDDTRKSIENRKRATQLEEYNHYERTGDACNIPQEPRYGVTSDGMVFNFETCRWLTISKPKGKVLYFRVNIKNTVYYLHRLLAEAFCPNLNNDPWVLHEDDIKTNNSLDNLFWGTELDNSLDRFKNKKKRNS